MTSFTLECVHEETYFVMRKINDLFLDCYLFIVRVAKHPAETEGRKIIVMIKNSTKQRISPNIFDKRQISRYLGFYFSHP